MLTTKFRCRVCGKITAGRMPRGDEIDGEADGSARFPRRHLRDGYPCPGDYVEAEWINVDEKGRVVQEKEFRWPTC